MKISQATALIRTPLIEWSRPQSWCDLGCGSGTFTTALALLLASGSTIHAVDLDHGALAGIPDQYDGVAIRKVLGDLRSVTPALVVSVRAPADMSEVERKLAMERYRLLGLTCKTARSCDPSAKAQTSRSARCSAGWRVTNVAEAHTCASPFET